MMPVRLERWFWMVGALLFCVVLLGASCKRNIPPPENEIKDAALLIGAVDARIEQFESARFKEVVLEYYQDQERVKVRQLILVSLPDKLRVQTRLPGSDEVMNLLVSNGEVFAMHRRDTNEYLTGRPTQANIDNLLPLGLSAQDVVRVMLGGAPWGRLQQEEKPLQLEWNGRTGRYRLWVETRRKGRIWLEVRHTDFAVVEMVEEDAKGDVVYRYETDDWRGPSGLSLPEYRRFEWPAQKLDFSVEVGETQVNVELPDTLFEFDPPAGSQVIEVDDNGIRR